jgi:hypothetical protein
MSRNVLMSAIALLSLGALVATALGTYRVLSYIAALLIVGVVASSSIERGDREFDIAPYGGLVALLGATFLVGLTVIWLFWTPGQTAYTYLFGIPQATLAYLLLIWLAPLLGAILYSLRFPAIGDDDIVDDIMQRARSAQEGRRLPLVPERTRREGDD